MNDEHFGSEIAQVRESEGDSIASEVSTALPGDFGLGTIRCFVGNHCLH